MNARNWSVIISCLWSYWLNKTLFKPFNLQSFSIVIESCVGIKCDSLSIYKVLCLNLWRDFVSICFPLSTMKIVVYWNLDVSFYSSIHWLWMDETMESSRLKDILLSCLRYVLITFKKLAATEIFLLRTALNRFAQHSRLMKSAILRKIFTHCWCVKNIR